jgi:hypothetical protein
MPIAAYGRPALTLISAIQVSKPDRKFQNLTKWASLTWIAPVPLELNDSVRPPHGVVQ